MNPLRYLQLGLAALLLGAGVYFVWSYQAMSKKVAAIPELEAKVKTLSEGYALLSQETIRRDEFDRALRDRRSQVSRQLDQAADEDPAVRDYLGERIPDGVRKPFQPEPAQR